MAVNSADFAGMKKGLELIVNAGNDLRTQHGQAQSTVLDLQQYWSAQSAGTFQKIMTTFDDKMAAMLAALEEIEAKLESTLGIQIAADQDTELAVTQLSAALEGLSGPAL